MTSNQVLRIYNTSSSSTCVNDVSPYIRSTGLQNGTVFTSSVSTASKYKKVVHNYHPVCNSVYDTDDNCNPPSIAPRHTSQDLYELIANTLYCSQHLPAKDPQLSALMYSTSLIAGQLRIRDGETCSLKLPDGAVLRVEGDGSYRLDDKESKVIYRANRVRDFNTYLNASDKLEGFIRYCGEQGVTQGEMLGLPINLFVMWLIVEAARQDQVEESPQPLLEGIKRETQSRCTICGRFMRKLLRLKHVYQCRQQCFAVACS